MLLSLVLASIVLEFTILLSATLRFAALHKVVSVSASSILLLFIYWKFHVINGQNKQLFIQTCLEGHWLNLNEEGRAK